MFYFILKIYWRSHALRKIVQSGRKTLACRSTVENNMLLQIAKVSAATQGSAGPYLEIPFNATNFELAPQ